MYLSRKQVTQCGALNALGQPIVSHVAFTHVLKRKSDKLEVEMHEIMLSICSHASNSEEMHVNAQNICMVSIAYLFLRTWARFYPTMQSPDPLGNLHVGLLGKSHQWFGGLVIQHLVWFGQILETWCQKQIRMKLQVHL